MPAEMKTAIKENKRILICFSLVTFSGSYRQAQSSRQKLVTTCAHSRITLLLSCFCCREPDELIEMAEKTDEGLIPILPFPLIRPKRGFREERCRPSSSFCCVWLIKDSFRSKTFFGKMPWHLRRGSSYNFH